MDGPDRPLRRPELRPKDGARPRGLGRADRVLEALVSLEETARACLLLRTVLDKSYREISLALDIPEGTAMSHVHRARKAMRRMLEESPHDDETNDMGAQEHAR